MSPLSTYVTYTYIYICIYVYMYIYICMCVCVCVCVCVCIRHLVAGGPMTLYDEQEVGKLSVRVP